MDDKPDATTAPEQQYTFTTAIVSVQHHQVSVLHFLKLLH